MRKLRIFAFITALVLAVTVFSFSVGAASLSPSEFTVSGASFNGNVATAENISSGTIRLEKNIASIARSLLGTAGGVLDISLSVDPTYKQDEGGNVSYTIALDNNGSSGEFTLTEDDMSRSGLSLVITVTNVDASKLESLRVSNISITGTPNATPTPSPSPSPTPEDEDPSPSASASASPSASAGTANSPTPTATSKPNSGSKTEPTNDTYNDRNKVTNPPPTIVGDVDISDIDLATPVPEPATPTPDASFSDKVSNDPALGLIILFAVLLLLLAADIVAIIWRKKLGFSGLINGGVARRRVRDDLVDIPDPTDAPIEDTTSAEEGTDAPDSNE